MSSEGSTPLVSDCRLWELELILTSIAIPSMPTVDVPVERQAEYLNLLNTLHIQCQEIEPKLAMYLVFTGKDEPIKRMAAIVCDDNCLPSLCLIRHCRSAPLRNRKVMEQVVLLSPSTCFRKCLWRSNGPRTDGPKDHFHISPNTLNRMAWALAFRPTKSLLNLAPSSLILLLSLHPSLRYHHNLFAPQYPFNIPPINGKPHSLPQLVLSPPPLQRLPRPLLLVHLLLPQLQHLRRRQNLRKVRRLSNPSNHLPRDDLQKQRLLLHLPLLRILLKHLYQLLEVASGLEMRR